MYINEDRLTNECDSDVYQWSSKEWNVYDSNWEMLFLVMDI